MGMAEHLKTMMEGDVEASILDASAVIKFGRHSVTGTFGVIGSGDNIDPDGILQTADAEFVATRKAFAGNIPAIRSTVAVDGFRYYVESIAEDDAAITLQLKRGP